MSQIAFFDLEVSSITEKIVAIGCIRSDEAIFHKNHLPEFLDFIRDADFICGHNIIGHDLVYLQKSLSNPDLGLDKAIDTLLLSPLLFPRKPYHHLFKDDKLQTDELNNPVNDAKKARDLLFAEQLAFQELSGELKKILYNLLREVSGFAGFFKYVGYSTILDSKSLAEKIKVFLNEKICTSFDLAFFSKEHPVSLAYALVLLNCDDRYSITPPWVLRTYPEVESVLLLMRNTPCLAGCTYCDKAHDSFVALHRYFGFSTFRSYQDEPLQENAISAAINGNSLLAVFPTGGWEINHIPITCFNERRKCESAYCCNFTPSVAHEGPG